MIAVIASIRVKEKMLSDFLPILKANVPQVRREKGCIEYLAVVDLDAKLGTQVFDADTVTILEKWESLEALQDHLGSPHMLEYRDKVKNIVKNVSVKVLQEV